MAEVRIGLIDSARIIETSINPDPVLIVNVVMASELELEGELILLFIIRCKLSFSPAENTVLSRHIEQCNTTKIASDYLSSFLIQEDKLALIIKDVLSSLDSEGIGIIPILR